MPSPRLMIDAPLAPDLPLPLPPDQSHYLVQVMRMRQGDEVRLFNGRDGEWRATIEAVAKKSVVLRIEQCLRPQSAPPPLTLAFAIVKRAALEWIVEKATELGATTLQPVVTQRTNQDRINLDRLSAIVREAAEQTERLDLPLLQAPLPLQDALVRAAPDAHWFFADETGDDPDAAWGAPWLAAPTDKKARIIDAFSAARGAPAAILIGPEGGFTAQERAMLRSIDKVTPISLGPRILRAETAAIAALALWQACAGDWS